MTSYAIIQHIVKRTTIFIPEPLERDLQLFARRSGKPTAALVREALAAYLTQNQPPVALPSFTGAFDSGHSDTAERHDEILFKNLLPDEKSPRPRARTQSIRRTRHRVKRRS
jgi:hypothetical protein